MLRNAPDRWWQGPVPTERARCYRSKVRALKAFLDVNRDIVEHYGGPDMQVSPAEFDAINHKYHLKGRRAARTIAQAVWAAMPARRPYCLDTIDLDALNDTSPARELDRYWRLPGHVYDAVAADEQERYYRSLRGVLRRRRRLRRR